jgi:hypothetical protein
MLLYPIASPFLRQLFMKWGLGPPAAVGVQGLLYAIPAQNAPIRPHASRKLSVSVA